MYGTAVDVGLNGKGPVVSGEWRERRKGSTPGNADGCEKKRVAGKGIGTE